MWYGHQRETTRRKIKLPSYQEFGLETKDTTRNRVLTTELTARNWFLVANGTEHE